MSCRNVWITSLVASIIGTALFCFGMTKVDPDRPWAWMRFYLPSNAEIVEIQSRNLDLGGSNANLRYDIRNLEYNLTAQETYSARIDAENIRLCLENKKLKEDLDFWIASSHKYQSERNSYSFENEELRYKWQDLNDSWVSQYNELREWEACAKRRKEKQEVKTLPVVPKLPEVIEIIKPSLEDLVPLVIDSVVHISCPQWQGSGFILDEHTIVTARHVDAGVTDFEITFNCSKKIKATRAISSKKHDIGFIWVDEPMSSSVELGTITEAKLGQEVFVIGSSLGDQHFNSLTSGIISHLDLDVENFGCPEYMGWSILWMTDTATYGGNSGSPVFNMNGEVIGVLVGGYDDYESISYCVPVDVFSQDIEIIHRMFAQDRYKIEVAPQPIDYRLDEMYDWYEQQLYDYRLDEMYDWYLEMSNATDWLREYIESWLIDDVPVEEEVEVEEYW